MNWKFHAIPKLGHCQTMIDEFRELAALGIQQWLDNFQPVENAGESLFAEYPSGFLRNLKTDPVAYRFRFNVGVIVDGKFKSLQPPEYNVTIERREF